MESRDSEEKGSNVKQKLYILQEKILWWQSFVPIKFMVEPLILIILFQQMFEKVE